MTAAELLELIDATKARGFKLSSRARQVEKAARVEVRTGTPMPPSCQREAARLARALEGLPEQPRPLVKNSSHRMHDRVVRLIGREPLHYYSWQRQYQVMELTAEELKLVLDGHIKGLTVVADGDDWARTWDHTSG